MIRLYSTKIALFVCLALASVSFAAAQTSPDQQIPQPGQIGSPFPAEHSWNHLGLELSGGYAPVVTKGAGYFNKGFNVAAGVVDHFGQRWAAMAEVQIFGLNGSTASPGSAPGTYTNTVVSFGVAGTVDLLPRSRTSPYIAGGVGYYLFGPVTSSGSGNSDVTLIDSAHAVGFQGGAGIRHRLFADRQMELFAEGRYHYIASGSTPFGQMSLLPVSAGIRW